MFSLLFLMQYLDRLKSAVNALPKLKLGKKLVASLKNDADGDDDPDGNNPAGGRRSTRDQLEGAQASSNPLSNQHLKSGGSLVPHPRGPGFESLCAHP